MADQVQPTIDTGSQAAAADAFEALIDKHNADTGADGADDEVATDDAAEAEATDDEVTPESEDAEEDDSGGGDDEGDEDDDSPTHTIKVDGKDEKVSKNELIKRAQQGSDYTKKTQALAAERKAHEAEALAVTQERARYAELLLKMETQLDAAQPAEPNWEELQRTDPIEFAAQWAAHQRAGQQRFAIQQERQRVAAQSQVDNAKRRADYVTAEQGKLLEAIPTWKDSKVATSEKKAMVEYGLTLGYTADELEGVTDSRAVLTLRNAMKYAAIQKKSPQVQAQITKIREQAPPALATAAVEPAPVAKPAATRSGEVAKAKAQLAKTGSIKDAESVFASMLR